MLSFILSNKQKIIFTLDCCRKTEKTIMTLKQLETFARENGYTVEKNGKNYEWWRNSDHSMVGVCETIKETYQEIVFDKQNKN